MNSCRSVPLPVLTSDTPDGRGQLILCCRRRTGCSLVVLDASAVVEWLLGLPPAAAVGARLAGSDQNLHAPHLLAVEVAQVVRRYVARGDQLRRSVLAPRPEQPTTHHNRRKCAVAVQNCTATAHFRRLCTHRTDRAGHRGVTDRLSWLLYFEANRRCAEAGWRSGSITISDPDVVLVGQHACYRVPDSPHSVVQHRIDECVTRLGAYALVIADKVDIGHLRRLRVTRPIVARSAANASATWGSRWCLPRRQIRWASRRLPCRA